MSTAIIEQLNLQPIVYQGERCVTFQVIDQMHEREKGTARSAFVRHRERMAVGKHYYSMPLKEFRELGELNSPNYEGRGNPRQPVFLLTEKGYTMLVKTFDDDRAWAIQEAMSDGYFRLKAMTQAQPQAQPGPDFAALLTNVFEKFTSAIDNLAIRLGKIEASQALPERLGPRFGIRRRLNELLEIHHLKVADSWKASVMRRILGEAGLLQIELFQVGDGIIEMPIQYMPWVERLIQQRISERIELDQMPLWSKVK